MDCALGIARRGVEPVESHDARRRQPADGETMIRFAVGYLVLILSLAACDADVFFIDEPVGPPDAPRELAVTYYGGSVQITWELSPVWSGEAFRVYSRRVTDAPWFFIAEVTSCIDNLCRYEDLNIVNGQTYEYIVSAVSDDGVETFSDVVVEVFVPPYTTPPIPDEARGGWA